MADDVIIERARQVTHLRCVCSTGKGMSSASTCPRRVWSAHTLLHANHAGAAAPPAAPCRRRRHVPQAAQRWRASAVVTKEQAVSVGAQDLGVCGQTSLLVCLLTAVSDPDAAHRRRHCRLESGLHLAGERAHAPRGAG